MPEIIGNFVHIPVSDKTYVKTRTTDISEPQGISALYGQPEGAEEWDIRTYLFDTRKGWTIDKAQEWVNAHQAAPSVPQPMTVAATQQEDDDEDDVAATSEGYEDEPGDTNPAPSEPDPQKYIKVQFHMPAYFSGYRTKAYRLTPFYDAERDGECNGVLVSLGKWKKTGAQVIQKFLFETAKGWTPETVKQWFLDHPHYPMPSMTATGIFVALSDDAPPLATFDLSCVEELNPLPAFAESAIFDVVLIRSGWGKNRRRGADGQLYRDYFTPDFLQQLIPMTEGSAVQSVKINAPGMPANAPELVKGIVSELQQFGHPPEVVNQLFPFGLSGNAIGFLRNVRLAELPDPGQPGAVIRAAFCLADTPDALHARQLWQSAATHGLAKALGLSINYRASVIFTQIDGQNAAVFVTPHHYVSCEFVANPAAGGAILTPTQAEQRPDSSQGDHRMDKDQLKDNGQPTQDTMPATPAADVNAAQAATPAQGDPGVATPGVDVSALQAEIDALKSLKDDVAAMKAESQRKELVAMVTQSQGLQDGVKSKLLARIANGELTSPELLRDMIAMAQENVPAVQSHAAAPTFPGMGGVRAFVGAEPKDVNKIRSYMMWGIPLTQAEQKMASEKRIDPFWGLKDEYAQLTGDTAVKLHGVDTRPFVQNVHPDCVVHSAHFRGLTDDLSGGYTQSAILTTTYSDFLTHILNRTLEVHYNNEDKRHLKLVKKMESYSDNRDHTHFLLGQFPEIDVVTEGSSYTELKTGKLERVTSSSVKRGNYWQVSEETIQDDDLDYIKGSIQQIAYSANRTMKHQIMNLMIGYGTAFNNATMTDSIGGALYSAANRANYVNGTIENFDNVKSLINLMLTQVDFMDDGGGEAELELMPSLFVGNATLIGQVHSMIKSTEEPGREDNLANTLYFLKDIPSENFIPVHPRYLLNHPEFLCILPDPMRFPGMCLKYFRGLETPELIWEGNQQPQYGSHFASDLLKLRIKFKYRLYYYKLKAFHGLFQV